MGVIPEETTLRPVRAVSAGAGGTRGRVRTKEMPAFGWGPVEPRLKKRAAAAPAGDRRRRARPRWRAEQPSAKQMTAGALAALAWLAVTGVLVLVLL